MSLQGVLTDFGVADIFQLIAQQRKTGILSVEARSRSLEIHFLEGGVLRALPSESRPDEALAALMIRTGVLSDAALEAAWERQAQMREPLPRVLLSMSVVERDAIGSTRRLLTDETIFELFLWDEGRFSFRPSPVEGADADAPVGAEMVLLDALRMRDEWAQIKGDLRDFNVVVKPAVDIEEFRTRRAQVETATGMRPHELERVFTLVDGRLSVRRVLDLTRMGTFQGGRALVGLLREGVISLSRHAPAPVPISARAPRHRPALAYSVLGICVFWAALLLQLPGPRSVGDYPIAENAVGEVRMAATTERLRAALEAHRWAHGGYPRSLEGLREVHDTRLAPLPVDRYSYSRSAQGYVLYRSLSFKAKEAPQGAPRRAPSSRDFPAGR